MFVVLQTKKVQAYRGCYAFLFKKIDIGFRGSAEEIEKEKKNGNVRFIIQPILTNVLLWYYLKCEVASCKNVGDNWHASNWMPN